MAGTVKLDIEEETMIRLGVENYDSTRAIRSFIVDMEGEDEENYRSQLEAGVIDLKAALLAENNNETYDHPDDWDLDPFHVVGDTVDTEQTGHHDSRNPLQSITARNFGNSVHHILVCHVGISVSTCLEEQCHQPIASLADRLRNRRGNIPNETPSRFPISDRESDRRSCLESCRRNAAQTSRPLPRRPRTPENKLESQSILNQAADPAPP